MLKRKYDQVRRRTELAYIHGEKRAIGRLLTFLIRQFFSNDELRNASLDGRVRNTQALAEDRMSIIDKHLQAIFGIDYNLYRITKDCAEQVNVVCRHARNPKNLFDNNQAGSKTELNHSAVNPSDILEERPFDEYESFQEELFIQANGEDESNGVPHVRLVCSRFTVQVRIVVGQLTATERRNFTNSLQMPFRVSISLLARV